MRIGLLGAPELAWRAENLGFGLTSVAVAGNHVYTLCDQGDREFLLALHRDTGERMWATEIGPAHKLWLTMRWLTQRTPTIDANRVYAVTSTGVLNCVRATDGRSMWSIDYRIAFGTEKPIWGYCDYPLVDGDNLICVPGGKDASVVALNKSSGDEVWRTILPDRPHAGYAATVVAEMYGRRFYVVGDSERLHGIDAETGEHLWQFDAGFRIANSHTPFVIGEQLFVPNAYGFGIALLNVSQVDGGWSATAHYRKSQFMSALQDNFVVVGDFAYSAASHRVYCCNWSTGERLWLAHLEDGAGRISMTWADNSLYMQHGDGTVVLARVNPNGATVTGRFRLPEAHDKRGSTYPVISAGRLYLRDEDRLFCYIIGNRRPSWLDEGPRLVRVHWPAVEASNEEPFPIFVATPPKIATRMLELADTKTGDLVVDLGSGDGVIVAQAAKHFGANAIGYEINEELAASSRTMLDNEGLSDRAQIRAQDMYTADLSDAAVVTAYLNSEALEKLKPQFAQMKPGGRIVTHGFQIPGATPIRKVETRSERDEPHAIWLYRTPLTFESTVKD